MEELNVAIFCLRGSTIRLLMIGGGMNIDSKQNNLSKRHKTSILAFAHITRAGGNTLLHILRYNYFLRSCDVRPLSKQSGGIFCAEDMAKTLIINHSLNVLWVIL